MQFQAQAPRWTTATLADFTDTAPHELRELGAHVSRCNGLRGRWFALQCTADALNDFMARRFVTSLVVLGGVAVLAVLTF